jgi:hypothetical protein
MEKEKMMKPMFFAFAALTLLLSAACAQATPTVDPAQIQASAVAAANTMVALTQAAIPTATEVPPTPLPSPTDLPTPTAFALPTLDNSFPTASVPTAASSGGDPCNQPMSINPSGKKTPLHIVNTTKGTVNLSLYLNKTPFGECGFARISPIPKNGDASYTLPSGTYYACGYANDPKHQSTPCGYTFTIKGPLKLTLYIYTDTFKLVQ